MKGTTPCSFVALKMGNAGAAVDSIATASPQRSQRYHRVIGEAVACCCFFPFNSYSYDNNYYCVLSGSRFIISLYIMT